MLTNKTIINWDSGIVKENEPIFIEFNNYLRDLGLNIEYTQFSDSNYITIFVHSIDDVLKAKDITKEKGSQIVSKLLEIGQNHGQLFNYDYAECLDLGGIYSFEIKYLEKIVRECKGEFFSELSNRLNVKPRYIFCQGASEIEYDILPGYNLIFDNPQQLESIDEREKTLIDQICNNILDKRDKARFYSRNKIEIRYYDRLTNAKSLYGMSRED